MKRSLAIITVAVIILGVGIWLYQTEDTKSDEASISPVPEAVTPLPEPEMATREASISDTREEPNPEPEKAAGIFGWVAMLEEVEPISDALVVVSWRKDEERQERRLKTDAEGTFHFADKGAGNYRVEVSHPEWASEQSRYRVEIPEGEQSASVEIWMVEGGSVSGRVYDARTQEGIAGVEVGIGRKRLPGVMTDENGHYRLGGVREGDRRIYYEGAKGYLPSGSRGNGIEVAVAAGESTEGVDIALQAGVFTSLAGIVVNEAGKPVSGIEVMLTRYEDGFTGADPAKAHSKPNGTFLFTDLEVADGYFIEARTEGGIAEIKTPLALSAAGIDGLVLTLRSTATISGKVVDHSGNPIADSDLKVSMTGQFRGSNASGFNISPLDENGAFRIEGLSAGAYGLLVQSTMDMRSTGWITAQLTLDVEYGEHIQGITLKYDYAAYMARKQSAQERRHTSSASVRERPADLEINGQVLMADTGEPLQNFTLRKEGSSHGTNQIHDNEGRFSVTKRPGAYKLSVTILSRGYAPQTVDVLDAFADTGLVIRLRNGALVEGEVVNVSGEPVAGAQIYVGFDPKLMTSGSPSSASGYEVAVSAPDGRFTLDTFPNAPERIYITHPTYAMSTAMVYPSPSRVTKTRIVLMAGGAFEGRVTANGQGVQGRSIMVLNADGKNVRTPQSQTDSDGRYRYEHFPPGEYTLYTSANSDFRNHRMQHRESVSVEGRVTVVDFDFSDSLGALEGVVKLNGFPVRASIRIEVDTGFGIDKMSASCNAEGEYAIENVPAGSAQVSVHAFSEDRTRYSKTVTIVIEEGIVGRRDFELSEADLF